MANLADGANPDTPRPPQHRVNMLFVLALTARLRARGVRVSPVDTLACLTLLNSRELWTAAQIGDLLAPVVARSNDDRQTLKEVIFDLLTERHAAIPFSPAARDAPISPPPRPPSPPPPPESVWTKLVKLAKAGFDRVILGWDGLYSRLAEIGPRAVATAVVAILVVGLLLTVQNGFCESPNQSGCVPPLETGDVSDESQFALIDGIDAALAALALVGFCLLSWRAWVLLRAPPGEPSKLSTEPDWEPIAPQADRSMFRVGSVGGKPPDFLPPRIGIEIAEMLGYRLGDPDPRRVDVRRTLSAHARGGDLAQFIAQRRRELPTILLLRDRLADALQWNTLPAEFEKVVHARGIGVENIAFAGSFFSARNGRTKPRPEAIEIERLVTQPGWTVTVVFAEAHRLGRNDILFLLELAENGPLVFLDLRDHRLWDRRHVQLREAGVTVVEATAEGLREALARVFAPDRANPRAFAEDTQTDGEEDIEEDIEEEDIDEQEGIEADKVEEDVLDSLGQDARLWATDCALVEPISFALAERLRDQPRYTELQTQYPSLAFSRLAALPGTWCGPEGLNFEAPMRQKLLSFFGRREEADRRQTLAVIEAAFAEAAPTDGVSAKIVHSYARNLVHIFAGDLDAAIKQVVRIETGGLLYNGPVRDLLGRLRSPQEVTASETGLIRLPYEPRSAAVRRHLSAIANEDGRGRRTSPLQANEDGRGRRTSPLQPAAGDSYTRDGSQILPARWSIGLPASRTRLGDGARASDRSWAAFFSGGRHLLLANLIGQLTVLDTFLGNLVSIALPTASSRVAAIAMAADAPVAVICSEGEVHTLKLENGVASLPSSLAAERLNTDVGLASGLNNPIAAVDPSGRFAFVCDADGSELLRCSIDGVERPSLQEFPGSITALAVHEGTVLVGLADGKVYRESIEKIGRQGSSSLMEPSFVVSGSPTAMAVSRVADTREVLVAATSKRQLECHDDQHRISTLEIGGIARRVVPFADRRAATIVDVDRGEGRFAGVSVAILGNDGSFDVVGMPVFDGESDTVAFTAMSLLDRPVRAGEPSRRAVAIAGQSSRVAVLVADRNGWETRIEIRPLDYTMPQTAIEARPRGPMSDPAAQFEQRQEGASSRDSREAGRVDQ
jgi:hypothetical protein